MPSIAPLENISDALDTGAKFVRVLADGGVTHEQFRRPIDNRAAKKNLVAFLKAGCPAFTAPHIEPSAPPLLLAFDDKHVATVTLVHPHDPQAFWHDTSEAPARYVWGMFTQNVVAHAKPTEESGIIKIPYADLSRNTTVREILDTPSVGDNDPSRLSKLIASMIAVQPNGEFSKDGLLNDGRGNLFKCGSLLVSVGWRVVRRGWYVSGWNPVSVVNAGRRVFSGNLIR